MITRKRAKLMAVGTKLDVDLVNRARKKMESDKAKDSAPTWRELFEYGLNAYLNEKK